MAAVIEVTDNTFAQVVLASELPIVVDFSAVWCPPCRVIEPMMKEFAHEYAGKLVIAKIDTDENPLSVSRLGIQGAPTVVIFKGGKEVGRLLGAQRKWSYKEHFDAVLQEAVEV